MAGPLGFSEAGRHFYHSVLVPFVQRLGYEVLDPWALTDPQKTYTNAQFEQAIVDLGTFARHRGDSIASQAASARPR